MRKIKCIPGGERACTASEVSLYAPGPAALTAQMRNSYSLPSVKPRTVNSSSGISLWLALLIKKKQLHYEIFDSSEFP